MGISASALSLDITNFNNIGLSTSPEAIWSFCQLHMGSSNICILPSYYRVLSYFPPLQWQGSLGSIICFSPSLGSPFLKPQYNNNRVDGPHLCFEPLLTCSLYHLSMKTVVLVAVYISSEGRGYSWWVSLIRYVIRIGLFSGFLPNPELFEFQMNQFIHFLVFFLKSHSTLEEGKLHTFEVLRALTYYFNRIKLFRNTPRLFIAFAERIKGQA